MKTEQNWTDEPWAVHPIHKKAIHQPKYECWIPASEEDSARIVACVNAMAGIANPASELARLRECEKALEELIPLVNQTYPRNRIAVAAAFRALGGKAS